MFAVNVKTDSVHQLAQRDALLMVLNTIKKSKQHKTQ